MQRIARQVRRPTFIGRYHHWCRTTRTRHRRCIVDGLAWHHPLNALRERQDVRGRTAAACQTHHAHGGTHDLQEAAAGILALFIVQFITVRELAAQILQEVLALLQLAHAAPVTAAGIRFVRVLPNPFH